jgi:hydrogenase maturation factor HypF (carbamoyltransferase family)
MVARLLKDQSPAHVRVVEQSREAFALLGLWDKTDTVIIIDAVASGSQPGTVHLYHLLMDALGSPVVATSGNIADKPMCIDEAEALTRLHGIAEVFLVRNRPIARSVDDSVERVIMGRDMVVRGGRGYAPCSFPLITPSLPSLALGTHLKTTIHLPGGETAIREPRRTALGLLHEVFGEEAFALTALPALQAFSAVEQTNVHTMRPVTKPVTERMSAVER